MNINVKDNITIVNDDKEVIAVIMEKEVIIADGYEALYDVGVEEEKEGE